MIKISVIIPIYNVEKYIQTCVSSLYNQSINENELEIIIVDDESPDNSLSIVKKIAKNHSNITIISQKNKGLGGARNTGIQMAKGQYLLFLDSDDYLLPKVLPNIINIARQNNLDILEFGAQGILATGNIVYEVSKNTKEKIYNGITYYNKIKYMNSACNKLYKRDLLLKNNILFLEKIYIEDFEFNTRAFFYAKKVMAISNIVSHYLQTPDSITRNTSIDKKEKMLNDLITVLKLTKQFRDANKSKNNSKEIDKYFGTRLSFINTTLFYQLFKNKSHYSKINKIHKQLKSEGVFCIKNSVNEMPKDIFRIIMMKNIWLFKIVQPLQLYFGNHKKQ